MDHQERSSFTRRIFHEIIRFHLVGALNTALAYGVYAGLVFIGVHHQIALVADYAFGIVFGYLCNKRFTFKVRRRDDGIMLLRMLVIYVPLLLLNLYGLRLLADYWQWNKYLAQAVLLILVTATAYVAQRFFVFRLGGKADNG